jgi:hypothetical protein
MITMQDLAEKEQTTQISTIFSNGYEFYCLSGEGLEICNKLKKHLTPKRYSIAMNGQRLWLTLMSGE